MRVSKKYSFRLVVRDYTCSQVLYNNLYWCCEQHFTYLLNVCVQFSGNILRLKWFCLMIDMLSWVSLTSHKNEANIQISWYRNFFRRENFSWFTHTYSYLIKIKSSGSMAIVLTERSFIISWTTAFLRKRMPLIFFLNTCW